jgi:transposase
MVKKRRQYAKEFKREAVQLAVESAKSVAEVARDLGITPSLLHKWRHQVEKRDPAAAFPGNGKVAEPEEEVRQLRRELERVKQERDFLKKAAAFFARESP